MKSLSPLKTGNLKGTNKAAILRSVWDLREASKPLIEKALGLSRGTVSVLVNELLLEGWLENTGRGSVSSLGGKPPTLVRINQRAGLAVGATIDRGHIEAALVDLGGNVVLHERLAHSFEQGAKATLDQLNRLLHSLIDDRPQGAPVLGVCVSSAGLVDHDAGVLIMAAHLPGWRDVPIKDAIAAEFDLPVYVDSDTRLWALAEYLFGQGRDVDNLVCVGTRLGLGCGVIIDGQLFRGVDNGAGELGHTVIDATGPLCRCGRRGCWETFTNFDVTEEHVRQHLLAGEPSCLNEWTGYQPQAVSIDQIYAAATQGDPLAVRWAVTELGYWFGVGIANLVNVFNPERVILLGKPTVLGDPFVERIREVVASSALPLLADRVEIHLSKLGERVRVLGPAAMVMHEEVLSPHER